jgi:hypothetical protein
VAIISLSHNFIFVKTRKTAGTSLEIHLARHCTDKDIVTPIYPEDSAHKPRNYQGPLGAIVFYNHMPAVEIRERCPTAFQKSYKFGFERHPVEKCLSHFALLINSPYHQHIANPSSWEEYLERGEFPIDTRLYTDAEGNLIIDKLYKYEEIIQSFAEIAAITGIPNRPLTATAKSGFRYNVPTFSEVMASSDQCGIIWKAFEPTLRFVDYS